MLLGPGHPVRALARVEGGALVVWQPEVPWTLPVSPESAEVILHAGSVRAMPGAGVTVPITATGFSNLQSARFSLAWDARVLEFAGVAAWNLPGPAPGLAGPVASSTLTVAWEHPDGGATVLAPGSPLLALRFLVVGNPGQVGAIRLAPAPFPAEAMDARGQVWTIVAREGWVEVVAPVEISGQVTFRETGLPVTHVDWTVSGEFTAAGHTLDRHQFRVAVPAGSTVRLAASRTNDTSPARGVTTVDLVQIRRHVLGLAPIGSAQALLAADADGSGTVTTLDLALVRRLILGQSAGLPAGTWRFLPADLSFPTPAQPWAAPSWRQYENLAADQAGQDFVGVRLGDVDASWAAAAPAPAARPAGGDDEGGQVRPWLALAQVPAGQSGVVTLALVATNFTRVRAAQFSLAWDPALLACTGFTAGALPGLTASHVSLTEAGPGRVALAWDEPAGDEVTVADGVALLWLHFMGQGAAGGGMVAFADQPTPRELVRGLAAEWPLTLDAHWAFGGVASPRVEASGAGMGFTLAFRPAPGVAYGIEFSEDLATWRAVEEPSIKVEDGMARWTDDGSRTGGLGGRRFYRVVAR
ncbi:MAG: hypothetical protein RJA22_919 [Verrucomicrobiota bacterium]